MAGWNLPEPVGLHKPAEKAQFKVKNEISFDYDTSFWVVFLCLAIFDSASFPSTTYVAWLYVLIQVGLIQVGLGCWSYFEISVHFRHL